MKMKSKGKVHPSSSSTPIPNTDSFPVLKLLPAAVLSLLSVLSLGDTQVLAYMLSRSLQSEDRRTTSGNAHHTSPAAALFDCDCFHCYTSFWFRWDSSPHRELIHRAIEAFENGGDHFDVSGGRNKMRKGKAGRKPGKPADGVVRNVLPEMREEAEGRVEVAGEDAPAKAVGVRAHKGLARKVLPDVMGIFSSRLWSLWSPNV